MLENEKHLRDSNNTTLLDKLIDPFRYEGRFDVALIVVYIIVNGLVLINACLHDPRIGYDAPYHLAYIQILSTLRLPTFLDTPEFFSSPLPYVFPSLIMALTSAPLEWAAKMAQFVNVILSLGLTYSLIKVCHLINPASSLKLGSLAFLGLLPVYYKTFAFVRGEPYVTFFAVVILYYVILIFIKGAVTSKNVLTLSFLMGAIALSRQWGFLLFPAIIIFVGLQCLAYRHRCLAFIKALFVCLLLSFLMAGWFYIRSRINYDSVLAFNLPPAPYFSFRNQPKEFYFGLSLRQLFTTPIRTAIPTKQLIPFFYSEVWGDYWAYFVVYGRDLGGNRHISGGKLKDIALSISPAPESFETNWHTIVPYLGRVNLVSLFPSILALVAIIFGVSLVTMRATVGKEGEAHQREAVLLLLLALASTLVGYLWFLIMYPVREGDTVKATYILQIFPIVSALVGYALYRLEQRVESRAKSVYLLILGGLALVFVHNLPVMITHYSLLHL